MIEGEEEEHVVPQVAGEEEIISYVLAAVLAESTGIGGAVEELFYREGGAVDRMAEEA